MKRIRKKKKLFDLLSNKIFPSRTPSGIHDVCWHGVPGCPHCDSKNLRKKDRFVRMIAHETAGLRKVFLRLSVYKYRCRSCGKYFRQRIGGILSWQRSTKL